MTLHKTLLGLFAACCISVSASAQVIKGADDVDLGCHDTGCPGGQICVGIGICVPESSSHARDYLRAPGKYTLKQVNILRKALKLKPKRKLKPLKKPYKSTNKGSLAAKNSFSDCPPCSDGWLCVGIGICVPPDEAKYSAQQMRNLVKVRMGM